MTGEDKGEGDVAPHPNLLRRGEGKLWLKLYLDFCNGGKNVIWSSGMFIFVQNNSFCAYINLRQEICKISWCAGGKNGKKGKDFNS